MIEASPRRMLSDLSMAIRVRRLVAGCALASAALLAVCAGSGAIGASDASLIVFERPDGLYTVHADETALEHVPGTVRGDENPAWSPDGSQIAFWHGPLKISRAGNIFVIDADGGNRRQLTHDRRNSDPVWSPDGQTIVYDKSRGPGRAQIWTIAADGSHPMPLTPSGSDNFFPGWAPGQTILFSSDDATVNEQIYTMSPDGSQRTQLTSSAFDVQSARWSSDGRIVFTGYPVKSRWDEIYVMNGDGTSVTRVTDNRVSDDDPEWSPDGKRIVFDANRAGDRELWVMNPDGSHLKRLTRIARGYACCPSWKAAPG
jgi:Tol biopolymer transport system component